MVVDYKTWAGNNMFFCKGKLVTGPLSQIWQSVVVHLIILTITVLWSCVCLPFLMKTHENFPEPTVKSCILDVLLLILAVLIQAQALKTQFTDPGIICRDPIAARAQTINDNNSSQGSSTAHIYNHRHCETCKIMRPPKASHCRICNNCVQNFDQ